MTPEETRGRNITTVIALVAAAPAVFLLLIVAASGRPVPVSSWVFNGVLNVVLAWLLIKGRSWVRLLTVAGFVLGGGMSVLRAMFTSGPLLARAIVFCVGALQVGAALVLAVSPSVRAYFQAENNLSQLKLNSN